MKPCIDEDVSLIIVANDASAGRVAMLKAAAVACGADVVVMTARDLDGICSSDDPAAAYSATRGAEDEL